MVAVKTQTGRWQPIGCLMPGFWFGPVPAGKHYRIAANARSGPSSGAATRQVRVKERVDL